jgi:hypothetical protein
MLNPRHLLILITAALLFACSSSSRNVIVRSKSSAVVVVHAADASVDDVAVRVHARNGTAPNGQPIPAQVLWTADDPTAKLMIEFVDPRQDCVRGKHCDGSECHAVTNVRSTGSRCEYKVWINNTAAKDPVIVVDNCCP